MQVRNISFRDMERKLSLRNRIIRLCLSTLLGVIALAVMLTLWGVIELCLYQPLTKNDFDKLFPIGVSAKKVYSQDAIKLSLHGEEYELHSYIIKNGTINTDYPLVKDSLGGEVLPAEASIFHWTKAPVCEVEFSELPESRIKQRFTKYWEDPSNYHSCIFISGLESFWFVYCPKKQQLFYLVYNI